MVAYLGSLFKSIGFMGMYASAPCAADGTVARTGNKKRVVTKNVKRNKNKRRSGVDICIARGS